MYYLLWQKNFEQDTDKPISPSQLDHNIMYSCMPSQKKPMKLLTIQQTAIYLSAVDSLSKVWMLFLCNVTHPHACPGVGKGWGH